MPVGTALAQVLVEKRPPKAAVKSKPKPVQKAIRVSNKGPVGAALGTVDNTEARRDIFEDKSIAGPTAPEVIYIPLFSDLFRFCRIQSGNILFIYLKGSIGRV